MKKVQTMKKQHDDGGDDDGGGEKKKKLNFYVSIKPVLKYHLIFKFVF